MRTLCVSLALVLALATTAASSVNVGPVWNQIAASRHFDLYPANDNGSFAQHYHGSNLQGDFASMVNYVNQVMNSSVDPDYDDLMNIGLENWDGTKTN
jgi:hypothetical protein